MVANQHNTATFGVSKTRQIDFPEAEEGSVSEFTIVFKLDVTIIGFFKFYKKYFSH